MQRHIVPPGITGWAQLHRGADLTPEDALDKLRYDLYYETVAKDTSAQAEGTSWTCGRNDLCLLRDSVANVPSCLASV